MAERRWLHVEIVEPLEIDGASGCDGIEKRGVYVSVGDGAGRWGMREDMFGFFSGSGGEVAGEVTMAADEKGGVLKVRVKDKREIIISGVYSLVLSK
jgi:hypothetical protein